MQNNKYSKFLTVLLIIAGIAGIVLIIYLGYDIYRQKFSNKDGEEAVDIFQKQFVNYNNASILNDNKIENNAENEDNSNNLGTELNENVDNNNGNTGNNNGNSGSNKTNTNYNYNYNKTSYQGYTMIGTIEIPKIKVKIPIVQEITPKALQKATCLIYGKLNQEENAVIIGHNNRNGTFFSNLKKLVSGDKITITDYTGKTVTYEVYKMFQASPDDTSFYQRNTNGLSEITLSTCTDNDDTKRIIVFAREI